MLLHFIEGLFQYLLEKMFRPAYGCSQHPKAGQNTQQTKEMIDRQTKREKG